MATITVHLRKLEYLIRTNIGEELNLVNWRIIMQSPSLNFANIFFIAYKLGPWLLLNNFAKLISRQIRSIISTNRQILYPPIFVLIRYFVQYTF